MEIHAETNVFDSLSIVDFGYLNFIIFTALGEMKNVFYNCVVFVGLQ